MVVVRTPSSEPTLSNPRERTQSHSRAIELGNSCGDMVRIPHNYWMCFYVEELGHYGVFYELEA